MSTATRHCAEHKDRVEGEQHSRRASTQAPLLYGNLQVKYRYHYKAAQTTSKTTRAKAPLCTQIYRSKPDAKKKAAQATSKKQHVKTPFYRVIYRKMPIPKKKRHKRHKKSGTSDAKKSGTSERLTSCYHYPIVNLINDVEPPGLQPRTYRYPPIPHLLPVLPSHDSIEGYSVGRTTHLTGSAALLLRSEICSQNPMIQSNPTQSQEFSVLKPQCDSM